MSLNSPKISRRNSAALKNVVVRRNSLNTVVNLNALVRVFFLDGSSKVLQMFENSTAADVLIALKFNLDLLDISTHALFRVFGNSVRRIDLSELICEVLKDQTDSGQEVRLLFRSWITYKYGGFDQEVFQYGKRLKQPNTALWLTYLEASFMCNTEKFLLTEDESVMLGCLRMQAESGDFNPSVHTLEVIKQRVISRFPNPIRSKMKALCSSTVAGNGLWCDLASRVQQFYARVAGKSKVEAQIDYLLTLRTVCPFYGCPFFEVHCQYDENPLEQASSPPILAMTAAVGPLAILLLTQTEPPVLMRHPYKRIIKWITYPDKHIFTYWVIKPSVSLHDLEDYQEEHSQEKEFNAKQFCDCVYLVTSQVSELDFLVRSYVEALSNRPPALPGASGDLLPPETTRGFSEASNNTNHNRSDSHDGEAKPRLELGESSNPNNNSNSNRNAKGGRFSVFFSALRLNNQTDSNPNGNNNSIQNNSNNMTGSGIADNELQDEIYGDDTAGVAKSVFQAVFQQSSRSPAENSHKEEEEVIPSSVQFAASMSELKRLAEAQAFSDSEEEEDDEEEEEDSEAEGSDRRRSNSENSHSEEEEEGGRRRDSEGGRSSSSGEKPRKEKDSPKKSPLYAMKRASKLLFKPFTEKSPKQTDHKR